MTYAEHYASEYLGAIFYYCLRKTGSEQEAEELYLTPAHRGKGLGHEFFAFAEDFYGKDLRRMRLETEPENEKAEKLYRNLGFDELGYRPFVKEFAKK